MLTTGLFSKCAACFALLPVLSGCASDSDAAGNTTTAGKASITGGAASAGSTTGGSPSAGAAGPVHTSGSNGGVSAAAGAETGGSAAAVAVGGDGGAMGGSSTGGSAGSSGVDGTAGAAPILSQAGNPVYGFIDSYKSWLSTASDDAAKLAADRDLADRILTWQLPHGGFYKNAVSVYGAAWNGSAARSGWTGAGGVELGTIDNKATVTELMFLADVYRRSKQTKYRDAARKALDFLMNMQYATGGFPQVYPERPGSYSNYVTFNDDAMVRVMLLLHQAIRGAPPLEAELFSAEQHAKLSAALSKGFEYILAAQIVEGGAKTVWCAQHDPKTYAPLGARSYELPSKSGSESVGIITLLLTQPQTAAVEAAVQGAIAWYRKTGVANTAYVSRASGSTDDSYNPIQAKSGATMWYRFYDLGEDVGFFSGRLATDDPPGNGKQYDIMKIEAERRYGYQWGGAYGTKLFAYTDTIGY